MESRLRDVVQRQAEAWANGDVEGIVSAFASPFEFIFPGARLTTPEELRSAVEGYFRAKTRVRVEIQRIVVDGECAVVEWVWSDQDRESGKMGRAEDAIVLRLAGDKIAYWREYIDEDSSIAASFREAQA